MIRSYWFSIKTLKNLHRWKLILLASVIGSCVFDRDKENFVEVDPTPDTKFNSELTYNFDGQSNYPMLDTILMLKESNIQFLFRFGTIYGYEIYANQNLVSSGQDYWFTLSGTDFEDGLQEVVIVQYAKSGTNSLSDQLNLEQVAYADTFKLKVLSTPPELPLINSVVFEDGNLVMKWDPYNDVGFQGYQISRRYSNSSKLYESKISEIGVAEWHDPLYIGVDPTYTLKVDIGGHFIESESFVYESDYDPNFKIEEHSGSVFLTWNKPPFLSNISSYTLYRNSDILSESIPGTDTSFLLDSNPRFGEIPPTYALHVHSNLNEANEQVVSTSLRDQVGVGTAVPPHNTIIYNAAKEKYYSLFSQVYYNAHYQGGIYELNKNLEVLNHFEHPGGLFNAFEDHTFVVSPDGESLYHYEFVTVTKIDLNTLEEGESIHTFRSNNFGRDWRFCASNNGLITTYEDSHQRNFKVLDFATSNEIYSERYGGSNHLSHDGQYLLLADRLLSYVNGTFELTSTLAFDDIHYSRFINDANDILIGTTSEVLVYSLQDMSVLKSYPVSIPVDAEVTFEPSTMTVGINSRGRWKFIDLINDHIIDENHIGMRYAGDYLFVSRPTHSYPGYAQKIVGQ